jgi:hypothetical protein
MVDKSSLNFLPKTFQTNANRRFLNATVDQLIQEPNLGRVYGYIGRQDLSPAYRTGDAYVQEVDTYSQFYQLEPGLVINKRVANTQTIKKQNAYNYVDLLNGIALSGGINTDHSRMFSNEYYNYEGFIDLDKLINYGKYYWLPKGPTTLDVNGGGLPLQATFSVTRPLKNDKISTSIINHNIGQVGYTVSGFANSVNPTITLVRGGSYTFNVGQPGHNFWIQSEPGLGAGTSFQDNIIKREVFGVINNGAETGPITFNVPTKDAQYFYESMPVLNPLTGTVSRDQEIVGVDLVTDIPFNKLQNAPYDQFMIDNNIDGLKAFVNKTIVLINDQDDYWYEPDLYGGKQSPNDLSLTYDENSVPVENPLISQFDRGLPVPVERRRGIWRIANVDGVIRLTYIRDWPANTRLFVNQGTSYGHIFIFKDTLLNIYKVPHITAPMDVLYYQDSVDSNVIGQIRLIDAAPQSTINVSDILGSENYTSPNGVKFTNGLKIRFNGLVNPGNYYNTEYVVEGVGKSITLTPWTSLITVDPNNPNEGDGFSPDNEAYDTINYDLSYNAPLRKDYIVINRSSVDGNTWSRTNRWFHEDVIRYSSTFTDPTAAVLLDNNYRGIRPIVEFDANLQLWNYGNKFIGPVTVIDTYITDLANQVEGRSAEILTAGPIVYKSITRDQPIGSSTLNFEMVSDLDIGTVITGPNIQENTTIQSISLANKTITLSKPLLLNVTAGLTFTFGNTWKYVSDDVKLEDGKSVIFVNEKYNNTRGKIYNVVNIKPHASTSLIKRTIRDVGIEGTRLNFDSYVDLHVGMTVSGLNIPTNLDNAVTITAIDINPVNYFSSITISAPVTGFLPAGTEITFGNSVISSDYNVFRTSTTYTSGNSTTIQLNSVVGLILNMKVVGDFINENTVITSINTVNNTIVISSPTTAEMTDGTVFAFNNSMAQIHLIPVHDMNQGEIIVATSGASKQNFVYWWNNSHWQLAQQKNSLNQNPLFDVFNLDGISWGDTTYFPSSSFAGSALFGYKVNTGTRDSELGFPLSYRSVGNIGDIVFQNFYDTDSFHFNYENKDQTLSVSNGYVHEINSADLSFKLRNNWVKITDQSKQYIQRRFKATLNQVNVFTVDIGFVNSVTEKNLFAFVNGVEVDRSNFKLTGNSTSTTLTFNGDLKIDDILVIKIAGVPQGIKETYTLPKNLVDNTENDTFETLTLGQIRNHLIEMANNNLDFLGNPSGNSNLRDINYKITPGKILQHSAGVHIAQLMFNNETTNIIKSIDFSRRSYNRFKDRFFYLLSTFEFVNTDNARHCLDTIMEEITVNSSSEQAFYLSDMIPFGNNKFILNQYPVYDTNYRKFNLITPYNVKIPTYRAVLVYLNDQQLLLNQDYTVDGYVVQLTASVEIQINDIIKIYEYDNTKGSMIPATPTKLGLYPKYKPEIYSDNSYIGAVRNIIQGHDGSKIVAFGDFRDAVILEFEKRIFNNISTEFINDPTTSYTGVEPGAFRVTDYSMDEWTQLLSETFLSWAGSNNVNIFLNDSTQNDPFSFNYGQGFDKLYGEGLPGYWRGIYKYFYDTDRPDTHPWEMLGFSFEPDWWKVRYGPAPYTSGNLVLWKDLELGVVYQRGNDSYIDTRYSRPGLLDIIPVDVHGNLLPPVTVIVSNWNQATAGATWRFGDHSPQETAWRRSSDYPFAVQMAWALAKPAQYCSLSLNRRDIVRLTSLDQIINKVTGKRKLNLQVTNINNFVPGSNVWIRDRLADLSLDVTANFIDIFDNHSVNLLYKTSGYTDKSYLQLIIDQASPNSTNAGVLIPTENYEVLMTKSAPVSSATYSAVIVEKSQTGFAVYGFDANKPYFTIIPRRYNNNYYSIKVSESSALVYEDDDQRIQTIPYGTQLSTRQQVVDFLVSYGRYLTSVGFQFVDTTSVDTVPSLSDWSLSIKEFLFWIEQGWDPSTVISLTPAGTKINFDSKYGVVDEITNSFNGCRVLDSNGTALQGKDYSTFRSGTQFELQLKNLETGIHLLDLNIVQYEHTLVFDNKTVFNDIIYEPNLGNRQYRIKIAGFKTREWDGSLFAPGFLVNYKTVDQWLPTHDYYKGDIVLYKNLYYTAKNFIPGESKFDNNHWYEINGDLLSKQLIPNMASNAQQFEGFYDVDTFDVNRIADMSARNSTGFTRRNYLTDVGLDDISQHKFYLGMIREKGTQAAVNAFLRIKLPYLDNTVQVDEQWAIRLGTYGGINQKQDVELSLKDAKSLNGTYLIELLDKNSTGDTRWNTFRPKDLLIKPAVYNNNLFTEDEVRPVEIPTAGPVLISEVDATVFNIQKINNISGLTPILGEGSRVWVAADKRNSWNVYRITANSTVNVISSSVIGNEIEFTTDIPHNLAPRDHVLIKNGGVGSSVTNLRGFYIVNSANNRTFRTPVYPNAPSGSGTMNAILFKLKQIRYNNRSSFAIDTPGRGWIENDQIWLDGINGNYEILRNNSKWTYNQALTPVYAVDSDKFGSGVDMKTSQDIMVIGAPNKGTGSKVNHFERFVRTSSGDYTLTKTYTNPIVYVTGNATTNYTIVGSTLHINDSTSSSDFITIKDYTTANTGYSYVYRLNTDNTWGIMNGMAPGDDVGSGFGANVKYNDLDSVVVGAPTSISDTGLAYVLTTTSEDVGITQIISASGLAPGHKFGASVASSTDGEWIAVGAPGNNRVYVYKLVTVDKATITFQAASQINQSLPTRALGKNLKAIDVKVYLNSNLLVPYIDYTVNDSAILAANPSFVDAAVLNVTPGYDDTVYIVYESYYKYVTDFSNTENSGSFGYSISFAEDGRQMVIGAPTLDKTINGVTYTNMGAAYVYERSVETFIADGTTASFSIESTPSLPTVYLDGVATISYTATSSTLTLNTIPIKDTVVTIETNQFILLESKTGTVGQKDLNFGAKVVICPKSCSIYVGATGFNARSISNGAVYRFVNAARLYGTIVSNSIVTFPSVGQKLRINGVLVTLTGTSARSAASDINNANIPGVTATVLTNNANALIIKSDSAIAYDKLIINSPVSNSALTSLSLNVYDLYQTITSNSDETTAKFGGQITLDRTSSKLLIGASIETSKPFFRYDSGSTIFDSGSTKFYNSYYRSGSAYLYEYQADANETATAHGNFAYAQTVSAPSLEMNDYFSTGIMLSKNWMMITALSSRNNAGTIYSYYNSTGGTNWRVVRSKLDRVDTRKIERLYLYNDNTRTLIADLPILDPEHGIPVPSAAEQIRYAVNYDPAIYSFSPNNYSFAVDQKKAWGKEHVGQLWWDTNALKYTEWNQGDLFNRLNTWGLSFPSSYISVYEWIESDLVPSEYAKQYPSSGPVYISGDVYAQHYHVDSATLQLKTKHYFWVRNSNTNASLQRRDSALAIQNLIANVRNINVPFAAILGTNALALFNCQDIVNNDTNLHISVNKSVQTNPIHEEWSMFDDGSDLGVDVQFLKRLNDSLAGEDNEGRTVPDIRLGEKEKYGLGIRPRQTTFVDKFAARQVWVSNVNAILATNPIVLLRDISTLMNYDPLPVVDAPIKFQVDNIINLSYYNTNFYQLGDCALVVNDVETGGWSVRQLSIDPADSTMVTWLVIQVQTFDLNQYWDYADWYAKQYSANTKITTIVDHEYEIPNINAQIGDVIKVKNTSDGNWKLILVNANNLELIGQQNATIQFNNKLYNNIVSGFGIDTQSFEVSPFAKDAAIEFRQIFDIVNYQILTKELRSSYKNIIKVMIDNISTQFKQNDWLLKTSLINIKHHVRTLNEIPVYVKQPEDIVTNFINEVKPFHTKIKQYVSSYDKTDLSALDVVDFDLPSYYNSTVAKYRQPQLGNVIDDQVITNPIYQPWLANHRYNIQYIDVSNAGTGYTGSTTVLIEGDGFGATAIAYVRAGSVVEIDVTNPGRGYTYAKVSVIGLGLGATAYAILSGATARTFKNKLKFDRYTYLSVSRVDQFDSGNTQFDRNTTNFSESASVIKDWAPNTTYSSGDLIIHNKIVYRTNVPLIMSGDNFALDNLIELVIRNWEPYKKYNKDCVIIYKNYAYVALTDFFSNRYFEFEESISVTSSIEWQPNQIYLSGTVLNYADSAYVVSDVYYETNPTPASFSENNLRLIFPIARYPGGYLKDAASRILAYYNPHSGMPGKDLSQLMSGINYPGVTVIGPQFDQAPGFGFGVYEQVTYDTRTYDENGLVDIYGNQALDSTLFSFFNDSQLGIRPEDMITDGSAFIDTNSSHAPEELVPGQMFDSLNIKVKTLSDAKIFNAPEVITVAYYADNVSTKFSFDPIYSRTKLPKGNVNGIVVINDFDGPQFAGTNYNIDWENNFINFYSPPQAPSTVFITLIGTSGKNPVADAEFIGDGDRTEYEIFDLTLDTVQQAYVKINGINIGGWNLIKSDASTTWLPVTAYAKDSFVVYNNFTYRVTEDFTSGKKFSRKYLVAANRVVVRFDNPPAAGVKVQIHLYNFPLGNKAYSEIKSQSYTVPSDYVVIDTTLDYVITPPHPIEITQPWESMISITVNGTLLEPSNQIYYTGNGSTSVYNLSATRTFDIANLRPTDVKVVVDGITQSNHYDYNLINNGVDIPIITFATAPKNGSLITISNRQTAGYSILSSNSINIKADLVRANDVIQVVTYSNHDSYDFHTEVFSGAVSTTNSLLLGFDEIGFDIQGFETEKTNVILSPTYVLSRPVTNLSNIKITLDGIDLNSFYDFVLITPTVLRIDPAYGITSDSVIVATHISEKSRQPDIEFRIFKGITETYDYLGIGTSTTTKLTRDLLVTDEWIYVDSVDVFSQPDPVRAVPGVLFIGGERITFYIIDFINQRIGQIRRATNGTGAPAVHMAETNVYDGGYQVEIPYARDSYFATRKPTTVVKLNSSGAVDSTLLSVPDTNSIRIGMLVSGTGIADRASVLAINVSNSTITLSLNNVGIVYGPITFNETELAARTTIVGKKGNQVVVQAGSLIRQGKLWLTNGKGVPSNGLGINYSDTLQANFLKGL